MIDRGASHDGNLASAPPTVACEDPSALQRLTDQAPSFEALAWLSAVESLLQSGLRVLTLSGAAAPALTRGIWAVLLAPCQLPTYQRHQIAQAEAALSHAVASGEGWRMFDAIERAGGFVYIARHAHYPMWRRR
jgi:hypothetical protein